MKFQIELCDVKPRNKKQEYYLKKFLKEAQECLDHKYFNSFSKQIVNYFNYANSIKGMRTDSIHIPDRTHGATIKDVLSNNKNKYLNLQRELYAVKSSHVPKNKELGKWVGVEIECFIPYPSGDSYEHNENHDDDDQPRTDNFKHDIIEMIKNNKIKYVSIKTDRSIRSPGVDYVEFEFTVLTKIDDMSNLNKLCALLKSLNAQVNSSCGLHIHLDQRDVAGQRTVLSKRLMRLNQALPLLTSIVPPSRRHNMYCSTKRSKLRNAERYMAINTQALRRFGTFEIRLHSGTTDFNKISNWIKLCFDISRCEKIKNGEKNLIKTIEQLKEHYLTDMSLELFTYFKSRIDKFVETESSSTITPTRSPEIGPIEANEYRLDTNNVASDEILF